MSVGDFILVFIYGIFIFLPFTSGVFSVYSTNQLPDALSTKLISGVSFQSRGLLSVVIRAGRREDTRDTLDDTQAPAGHLVAKSRGVEWQLQCHRAKHSLR